MNPQIRPLGDRVLVCELPREDKIGSLFIPASATDQAPMRRARVIAVGRGRVTKGGKLIEVSDFRAGDVVLFGKYTGTEIAVEGEKFLVMRAGDVLGVEE